jgi:hypothetical protein
MMMMIILRRTYVIMCEVLVQHTYLYLQSDMVPQYIGHHHHLGTSVSHYEPRSQQATSLRILTISLESTAAR